MSEEQKAKISAATKGKVITAEQRAKISSALKNRSLSAETKEKMSLARLGTTMPEATREKISATRLRIGFPGKRGKDSATWKGGKTIKDGYILISQPDHPHANNHGYVREHVLVMCNHLGRYLEPNEIIHHINGVKHDNRLENLVILTRAEHCLEHINDLLDGRGLK